MKTQQLVQGRKWRSQRSIEIRKEKRDKTLSMKRRRSWNCESKFDMCDESLSVVKIAQQIAILKDSETCRQLKSEAIVKLRDWSAMKIDLNTLYTYIGDSEHLSNSHSSTTLENVVIDTDIMQYFIPYLSENSEDCVNVVTCIFYFTFGSVKMVQATCVTSSALWSCFVRNPSVEMKSRLLWAIGNQMIHSGQLRRDVASSDLVSKACSILWSEDTGVPLKLGAMRVIQSWLCCTEAHSLMSSEDNIIADIVCSLYPPQIRNALKSHNSTTIVQNYPLAIQVLASARLIMCLIRHSPHTLRSFANYGFLTKLALLLCVYVPAFEQQFAMVLMLMEIMSAILRETGDKRGEIMSIFNEWDNQNNPFVFLLCEHIIGSPYTRILEPTLNSCVYLLDARNQSNTANCSRLCYQLVQPVTRIVCLASDSSTRTCACTALAMIIQEDSMEIALEAVSMKGVPRNELMKSLLNMITEDHGESRSSAIRLLEVLFLKLGNPFAAAKLKGKTGAEIFASLGGIERLGYLRSHEKLDSAMKRRIDGLLGTYYSSAAAMNAEELDEMIESCERPSPRRGTLFDYGFEDQSGMFDDQ